MNEEITVLDNGYVRLVDHMGDDLSIVRSARVSYNADWRTGDDEGKDEKLIGYLMRNKHNTPFESVVFTFEVKAPIFVFRQWHRHRTWSFNEVSARYSELDEGYYVPRSGDIGQQSTSSKQARDTSERHPEAVALAYVIAQQCDAASKTYKELLDKNVPRELARSVLPVATFSKMFATVDMHNLFHFLRLRLHSHAQYEIRVYAEAMLELIKPITPIAVKYFQESLSDQ